MSLYQQLLIFIEFAQSSVIQINVMVSCPVAVALMTAGPVNLVALTCHTHDFLLPQTSSEIEISLIKTQLELRLRFLSLRIKIVLI